MSLGEFRKRLRLSSVPLVQLNEQYPEDIASGCLIDYSGKRLLLTVSHATGNLGNWAIQTRFVPGNGTLYFPLDSMHFLTKIELSNTNFEVEDVDFSYIEVPEDFVAYRQEIVTPENLVKSETAIQFNFSDLTDTPNKNSRFGFYGMVNPTIEEHFGEMYFYLEPRMYDNLTFVRTEGDYHYFQLPFDHPGHEHFKGCSGAPILDDTGTLVALVCGGCITTNEIWGISVRAYKTPIDILVGNIS